MPSAGAGILGLILDQAMNNGKGFSKAPLALILASVMAGFIGFAFFAVALFAWLLEDFTLPAAAALAACAVMALSLLGFGAAIHMQRRKARERDNQHTNLVRTVVDIAGDIESELEEPVRDNPKTAMLLAALSGFMLTENSLRNR